MEDIHSASLDILDKVSSEPKEKEKFIRDYIQKWESKNNENLMNIPEDLEWLQAFPLTTKHFEGKCVLLDFFTYCCMNCLHILPFLHKMEQKYSVEDGLCIIGVHSAKFNNEKSTKNISNALQRYNITHPVLNDCDVVMWDEMLIKCWPTLVVVSPTGKILLAIAGENHVGFVESFIDVSLEFYKTKEMISREAIKEISSFVRNDTSDTLKYPGNLDINPSGNLIAISDTGNHRVLVCDLTGAVVHCAGGTTAGNHDGAFNQAQFNNPQGVTWQDDNILLVADCGNHTIRKIYLKSKQVVTICGTGAQGDDLIGGKVGVDQSLNSPWDIAIGGSPQNPDNESILYIAMSGSHQIWSFFLKDADWQKGVTHSIGECIRLAGSGHEENRNNSYPHKASFAQPSGLSIDIRNHRMFVADSESSTIRMIDLRNGAVKALVGGDIDPTNLFAYGDVDGKSRDAKLQHPLSVVWDDDMQRVVALDTYNNKIKIINPLKKTCVAYDTSYSADEYAVPTTDFMLNEPGGICLKDKRLFVADTNNHSVKLIDLTTGTSTKLAVSFVDDTVDSRDVVSDSITGHSIAKPLVSKRYKPVTLAAMSCNRNQDIQLILQMENVHLTEDADSLWQISICSHSDGENKVDLDDKEMFLVSSGKYEEDATATVLLSMKKMAEICGDFTNLFVKIESILYFCENDSKLCKMKAYKALLQIVFDSTTINEIINIKIPK